MQAAAEDLNIDLKMHYTEGNRVNSVKLVKKVLAREQPSDYLMYMYQVGAGKQMLELAEGSKVKSFIINTDILQEDKLEIGGPRERFKHWIGHMYPDDRSAGELLGAYLIETAKTKWTNKEIELIAISGGRDSSAALERNKGLELATDAHSAKLNQLVFAQWRNDLAAHQAKVLLNRYPTTNILWSASDGMALGATASTHAIQQDILVGGIDWTPEGLEAVRKGQLDASVGGHFMEGGWALVMLYDHFHQKDFSPSDFRIKSKMHLLHQDNVVDYIERVSDKGYRDIDFRVFSKHLNPSVTSYDFSLENLLKALP